MSPVDVTAKTAIVPFDVLQEGLRLGSSLLLSGNLLFPVSKALLPLVSSIFDGLTTALQVFQGLLFFFESAKGFFTGVGIFF